MTWDSFEKDYWRFYLQLEKEFLEILDYIELDESNYAVHSVKLMQLLLSIGSEVDSTLKEICAIQDKARPSMTDYAPVIVQRFPGIITQKVRVFKRNVSFCPFENWDLSCPAKSLRFWNAYNEVKHHRAEKYREASLVAVAEALAALYLLDMCQFHEIFMNDKELAQSVPEDKDKSKIFYLNDWTERFRLSKAKHYHHLYDDEAQKLYF